MIAQHEPDTLTAYNDGLGAGMEVQAKKGWRPLSFEEPFNTPPIGKIFVGVKKNNRRGSAPWTAAVMLMVDEPDGDGGYCFEGYQGGDAFRPDYWSPLPDPNDFISV